MQQKQTPKIGLTTKLFLTAILASLIPFIEQYAELGQLPGKEALLTFGLVVTLGLFRVAQQIVLDAKAPSDAVVTDEDEDDYYDETPEEPTDVPADIVESSKVTP